MNAAYTTPQVLDFGSLTDKTGHCSSGCNHDSVVHTDEFKSSSGTETIIAADQPC